MKKVLLYIVYILTLGISVNGCTEEYPLHTEYYQDLLVIESRLTDEYKHQTVKLSHVSSLENQVFEMENEATIWIEDDLGTTYTFVDNANGEYISEIAFSAIPEKTYTLNVRTIDGEYYQSRKEILTEPQPLDQLYFETDDLNEKHGVQIFAHIENNTEASKFLRYEFEETYKIVTPEIVTQNIQLENIIFTNTAFNYLTYDIILTPCLIEKSICYSTQHQEEIIQKTLNSNSSFILPIRFIEEGDFILRERYSILLKQFSQTEDAYNYYNTLKELGTNNNVFVENQPGYVNGNMTSVLHEDKKVIGFFEVTSVSKKRIYFNWYDAGLLKPKYKYYRQTIAYNYDDNTWYDHSPNQRMEMYEAIIKENPPWEFIETRSNPSGGTPLYVLARPHCANCTLFSSNIKPEFWED